MYQKEWKVRVVVLNVGLRGNLRPIQNFVSSKIRKAGLILRLNIDGQFKFFPDYSGNQPLPSQIVPPPIPSSYIRKHV